MRKVYLLSPSNYSQYSILVAEELEKRGYLVERIFVKKLFNSERLFSELRGGAARFIKKVFRKLIFKNSASSRRSGPTLQKVYAEKGTNTRSLKEFACRHDVPITFCNDFHSTPMLFNAPEGPPDFVVFTGGGIIRESLLQLPSTGVINCHMGILPDYRGMDCYVWALLNGDIDKIGVAAHLMDCGIDTGPIIKQQRLDVSELATVDDIEHALEAMMPDLMVAAVVGLIEGNVAMQEQTGDVGKQYFIPADGIRRYVNDTVLSERRCS